MDCRTGEIHRFIDEEAFKEKQKDMGRPLVPLSDQMASELEPLGSRQRKNYMRNKPCVCGSGKKFKKCCWSNYA